MTESPSNLPANQLMEFVLSLVTALLMQGAITDIHLARRAAMEAIAAYKASGQDELVTVAQILGFALTGLDNLRLSMATDLSLSMKLKIRGNANALNRSALNSTQGLEKTRRGTPLPASPPTKSPAASAVPSQAGSAAATPTTQPQPAAARSAEMPPSPRVPIGQQDRQSWAIAMQNQAAQLRTRSPDTSAAQRKANSVWAEVLTAVASELTQPATAAAKPTRSKTDLMRTTLLTGNPGFPAHLIATNPSARKPKA